MLNSQQIDNICGLISQYDYYLVYYRYDYTEYSVGSDRDYLIEVYCSDQLPVFENGKFSFTECNVYSITYNKYISSAFAEAVTFTPDSAADIIYTNAVEGYPQLIYEISEKRNFDYGKSLGLILMILVCLLLLPRIIFGGRT